ncbi:unnamed protein product [Caenorhabditis brenneri]
MSAPNLTTMPPTVLDLVLKHSNFEAIQILRKVCHDLRSHIDNTHLDSKLQGVILWENPPGIIWSEIHFDGQKMKIKYKKEENGCLVKYKDSEKLLQNMDFGTVAGNDLGLILKQQKTKMDVLTVEFQKTAKLRLSFDCLETVGGRFSASLKPHLESRRTLLPIEHFEMKGTHQQSQIFKILQYLDPAHLKIMRIRYPLNSCDSSSITMKIDKIRELEQWKRVEMINIHGLNIDGSLRDFVHFKVAEFELKQVSVEDLLLLRETILQRGPPNSLTADENCYEFEYRHFKDKKHFINKFGRPYRENHEGNSVWFYPFPGNDERVLNISWCEKGKEFSCFAIDKSDMVDF